jgi:HNH endonuclease/Homing endonuclease associated repeat
MTEPLFKLTRVSGVAVSDAELIADLRRVAQSLHANTVQQKKYGAVGAYDYSTIIRRFGSWNEGLRLAGLALSNEIDILDERLFENLLVLWQHRGRQPRRSELSAPPSAISQTPYNRRFGSWTAALEAFVNYANGSGIEPLDVQSGAERRTTGRDPSLRLRWHVLQRDRFTCCACGASPALAPGIELHVDHIVPWSKGGETVLENLQTLCSLCNLGKSNVHTGQPGNLPDAAR